MQSSYKSWLESITSTATGFFISLAIWYCLGIGIKLSIIGTIILTGVSLVRQYTFRRVFNKWI